MKSKQIILMIALFGLVVAGGRAWAEEAAEIENLMKNLDTQIDAARIAIERKQSQAKQEHEGRLRREVKKEALRKTIAAFTREANEYLRQKNYAQAKKLFEQLLVLDPVSKAYLSKKVDVCNAQLRIQQQAPLVGDGPDQLELARDLARNMEAEERQIAERQVLLSTSEIKQHMSLGNFCLAQKDYSQAIEEYKKVLAAAPDQKEAQKKLIKAKKLLLQLKARQVFTKGVIDDNPEFREQLIKEGFQEALASLRRDDYRGAKQGFNSVLESVNQLSIESKQTKAARQIQESAKKGPEDILSDIRQDKYDDAKKKLLDLIEKTEALAKLREEEERQAKDRILVEGYLKQASEYTLAKQYQDAKREVQKALSLDAENKEARMFLERIDDIVQITQGSK